ncbi:MAG: hypothetical protein D4Q79_01570 [Spirochaetia bacterium]|nr:MAG: hypothetical protein D4Q79_01570 [Spirochaetia bacterium]
MKPVLYACAAMFLYAFQNVTIEQKLAKYATASILLYFYLAMLPMAAILAFSMKASGQQSVWPSGNAITLVLSVGVAYFFADYFFISAYTSGGSVATIMTTTMLFPVFASIVKFFWVGVLPNCYQIASYLFAVVSILLLIKGNS